DAGTALLRFRDGVLGQLLVLTAGHGGAAGGRLIAGSRGRVSSERWEGWEGDELVLEGQAPAATGEWIGSWLGELPPEVKRRLLPEGSWDQSDFTVDIHDPLRYGIATELHDFAEAVA